MKKILAILAVLVLLGGVAGFFLFRANYVILDGKIYNRELTQLDLSGKPIEDVDKLAELTALRQLNLENTGISEKDFLKLQEALPDCEILWCVPFQGSFYPLDTKALTLTSLTEGEIPTLDYLTQLERVDANRCTDLDALLALQARRPECAVHYQVSAGGSLWSEDTKHLSVPNISGEELAAILPYLPQVETVDASGCRDYDTLLALQTQYPQCRFRYTVNIGEQEFSDSASTLTIENADGEEVAAALPYLPQLTGVSFGGTAPDNETIAAMKQLRPDVTFTWDFQLCGVTVSSDDKVIDLSGIPMESTAEVENALKYFNRLERVIMCDCGISNEEMDALGKRNPDIRFVWTVSLGSRIRLRTDATYFMPHQFGTRVTDKDLVNLKYCIDLECIDLGHQPVSDGSFLAYLPKMKYLLLADTQISDISGCANMPDLIYAELFLTAITDYSPLLSCKKLQDLNISYSPPEDLEDLKQMTWLNNLWFLGCKLSEEQRQELKAALPDTYVLLRGIESHSSTGSGWRELQNYYDMRDLLGMSYMTG